MHPIEQELIQITKFSKDLEDYKSKQEYMGAIARMVDQLGEDDFDNLSKEATDWFNAAARALSNRKALPNWDDPVEDSETPDDVVTDEELAEEPVDDEPAPDLPVRMEPAPKVKQKRTETRPPGKVLDHPEVIIKDERRVKRKAPYTKGVASSPNRDKFGFVLGSKNSAACVMFEKGARMRDVKASLGDTYYSLIGRVIKRGHKVIHEANGVLKIVYCKPMGRPPND